MCNAVFGKTMENIRNKINYHLVNTERQFHKLSEKPLFKDARIFCSELIGVHMQKKRITLNKPIYIGQAIFDLSKKLMQDFLYDYCFPKWGEDNFDICMTDTDSILAHTHTDDFYKDISPDIDRWLDTSEYSDQFILKDGSNFPTKRNKKVSGRMKDETAGRHITLFAGVGPKNCFQVSDGCKLYIRCKGISKSYSKDMKFLDYMNCVLGGVLKTQKNYRIASNLHVINTIETEKVALDLKDNKRSPLSLTRTPRWVRLDHRRRCG